MIVSQIVGGLGNQLFEYAVARRLALLLDQELKLDLSFFDTYHNPDVFRLDKFNVSFKVANSEEIEKLKRKNARGFGAKVYRRLFKKPLFLNNKYHIDEPWLRKNDWNNLQKFRDFYISGYLANPALFYQIEEVLKKEFTLKAELNEENKRILKQIKGVNAVMLHVRRGDYVNNNYFVNQPIAYYQKGIQEIRKKVDQPIFFIFSDDPQWTFASLKTDEETHYVNINDGKTDYMELALMSACKHAIIANSTFSWWAAWLIDHSDKIVIAPEKWYGNPIHQKWYLKSKIYQNGWQRI